jgi:hypothetical protein
MTVFTHLAAQTTIVYLGRIMELVCGRETQSVEPVVGWKASLEQRALEAAIEISRLAKSIEHLGFLKAHTFVAVPLHVSAVFLRRHLEEGDAQRQQQSSASIPQLGAALEMDLKVLRSLQSVNNISTHCLDLYSAADQTLEEFLHL